MVEVKPKSQKERILELLVRNGTVSNYELRAVQPAIFQIGTRIFELKEEGHEIVTSQDSKDRRKFLYTLKSREDLFR